MKIKFVKIEIENFLSLGNCEIGLNDRGFTLVRGINNNRDDMAKSNGSGKSSIFEAISWCLTGETIRGVKDVVNMFSDGGTMVSLFMDIDGVPYNIVRYRDHKKFKSDLKIYINGEDKSGKGIRDSEKLLKDYLPDLTSSLVGSVILLGQGLPQRFTNNTPAGRKEVLEKLSKSDFMIEDLKQRINSRKLVLGQQLRTLEDKILVNQTQINGHKNQIISSQQALANMSDVDELVTMLDQANENMNWLTNESGKLFESIKTKRDEVQTVTDQIGQIRLQIQQEQSNAMLDITNRKNEKNIQKNTVYNNILNLQNEVKKLENIKDVCPTCGQKLVGVQKPDTTEQKNQIEILQGDLRTLTEEYTQLCKEYDDLQSFYNDKLNQHINPLTLQKTTLSNELTKLNNDYNGIQDNIKRQQPLIQKLQNDITNHNATVENLNKLIIDSENSINKLNEELVYFSEEMDIVKTRLDIINKFITITNRDFRGYLLKNVIDFIDKKSKEYCMDIFQTDKLDFKLDGNNIDITYCGKPYEACSGGEKQKLDIIIQFAIRDMLCQFLDYRCNIIALDEIFDQMDSIGCDRIVDLITKKLTDVDSIFIITHHTDISIPSDSIITVVKQDNGISTINE